MFYSHPSLDWRLNKTEAALLIVALFVALLAFFAFYLDNGHLFSLIQGNVAYSQNVLHEIVHDARHAAGVPCH